MGNCIFIALNSSRKGINSSNFEIKEVMVTFFKKIG